MANLALKRQRKLERRLARKQELATYYTMKEVTDTLSVADWQCAFEFDAPEKILNRLSHHTKGEWFSAELIDEFRKCFFDSVIYCPELGIDRINKSGVDE